MIGRWLREARLWAVVALAVLAVVLPSATAGAAVHAYDMPTVVRVDVHRHHTDETRAGHLSDVPWPPSPHERSASPPARTRLLTPGPGLRTATNSAGTPSSVIDDVMAETRAGAGNLTSKYTLTANEALTAGERWVGPGYTELGKPGSGVFRSADGTRQFRIDNGSITGAHSPGVPHVHLEAISPGSKVPVANNHIPFTE